MPTWPVARPAILRRLWILRPELRTGHLLRRRSPWPLPPEVSTTTQEVRGGHVDMADQTPLPITAPFEDITLQVPAADAGREKDQDPAPHKGREEPASADATVATNSAVPPTSEPAKTLAQAIPVQH